MLRGQQYVTDMVKAVQDSAVWKDSVIIITYDEAGGRWDHVPPPRGDRWGPGVRVPAIIISPYAKRSFVDHTTYETTSILKLIETRWNLPPLGPRAASATAYPSVHSTPEITGRGDLPRRPAKAVRRFGRSAALAAAAGAALRRSAHSRIPTRSRRRSASSRLC